MNPLPKSLKQPLVNPLPKSLKQPLVNPLPKSLKQPLVNPLPKSLKQPLVNPLPKSLKKPLDLNHFAKPSFYPLPNTHLPELESERNPRKDHTGGRGRGRE